MMPATETRSSGERAISPGQWFWRALLSMADQALVSGANFLLAILFARWLSRHDYGAVSIGLSVFLLAANFHHALVLEPMSVLGPRRFSERLGRYFSAVLVAHAGAIVGLSFLVLLLAGLVSDEATARALGGLAASLPLVLTFWVLRRICYVRTDPAAAVRGGLAFLICALAGAVLLRLAGWMNSASLFLATGAGALSGGLALLKSVGRTLEPEAALLGEVARAHWSYGRWMVGVSLTYWLAHSAYAVLLGLGAGLAASAGLRAVENLLTPVLQLTGALSLLVLPRVSGQAQQAGGPYLRRFQRTAMTVAAALVGGYLLCAWLLREPLMRVLYGPGAYAELARLVPVLALATLVRGVSDLSLSTALKGAARPEAHFAASLLAAAFVLTGGWSLIRRWDVTGAAWSMLASQTIQALVLAVFFARITSGRERARHDVVH
ncbi:MAG: hypothetical protein RMI94_07570 [Bryobacterales bacterium]|nr:hypothetical protein [Bryobacteraceae bacterium]MDW8130393.1 hypothetical protein [Bryobacterales bacterium]